MTRSITPELPLCAPPGCGNLVKPPSRADQILQPRMPPRSNAAAHGDRAALLRATGCRNRVKPPRGTRPPNKYCCRACANEGRSEQMSGTPRRDAGGDRGT